jgi:hypothetical protein
MEGFLLPFILLRFIADNITFVALILAFLAYSKSIEDKYDSWKVLLKSFWDETHTMHAWLNKEYDKDYYDKDFFNPYKQVFKLKTVAAEEVVKRGIYDIKLVDPIFADKISLFIERITAFNSAIDHMSRITAANPMLSQSLWNKLKKLGLHDDRVAKEVFKNKIEKTIFKNIQEYLLSQNIFNQNKVIHNELISLRTNEDRLSYLYYFLQKETTTILGSFKNTTLLPFYIKHKSVLIIVSIILYFLIKSHFILWF